MTSAALTRPESFQIGRVLNNSFAVIGRNIVLCLGLGICFYAIPKFGLWLWYVESGGPHLLPQTLLAQHPALVVIGCVFYLGVLAVLQTSIMRAAIVDMRGEKPSFSDCFGVALAALFPILGASLLVTLGVALGLILLIVPGIMLLLRWVVTMPVLIQEHRGILDSMARSRDLTKGSRWALLGLWLVLIVASAMVNFVTSRTAVPLNAIFGALVDSTAKAVVAVFTSVVMAVTYVELRQIKEGTGVEQLEKIFS